MAAYLIFTREGPIRDVDAMNAYSDANRASAGMFMEKFKIRPLAVYGAQEVLEGEGPDGVVLLQFPTVEDARGWYNCPEYQAAMQHRMKGATYRCTLVEGL